MVLARIGNLELVARSVVDGFINGMHRSPYFGASVDFAEHRGYVPGRRHPPRRLAAVRADRPLLHQGVRGGHELQLRGAARRLEVDGVRQPRHHQARLRPDARRVPDLSGAPAARPRRARGVRQRHRRVRAAVGQAHGGGAARARSAEAAEARNPARADEQDGRALRPPRRARARLGSLRGARRGARGDRPAAVPRPRHRSCSTCSIRAELEFAYDEPSAFEDLESGEQIPIVPEALAEQYRDAGAGAHATRSPSGSRPTASTTR